MLAFLGFGDTEILLIMVAILIFFGGKRMPELARGLGKALREFRKATGDVEREFRRVMDEAEHPVATVFRDELPAPAKSRLFTPPTIALPSSLPAAISAPVSPARPPAPTPIKPPDSETHRFRTEPDSEFHSDI
jgi:sec-independent protein translocase protein TatA